MNIYAIPRYYLDAAVEPAAAPGDLCWQDAALCQQVGDAIFFPEKGESSRPAKSVCRNCPVREPCLQYALETDQRFGIWGGTSERQRRRLKRQSATATTKEAA